MNNETDKISEERIAVRIDRISDLYCGIVLVVVCLLYTLTLPTIA